MQDTDIPLAPHAPAARKDEMRPHTLSHRERTPALGSVGIAERAGPLRRALSFLFGVLTLRFLRVKTASAREALLETVVKEKNVAPMGAHSQAIAFKGSTANILVTPLGTYAGKSPSFNQRKEAEKLFHAMQPDEETTMH